MYAIIDIESNGAGFREESIIDIAIYKYDGHQVVDQFISLVNPESNITPFVQKLTGISQKMVKTAPKFHEIAKRVIEITENTTLVGHNIEFDYRMLRQSFKRLGFDFEINTLDTITLSKKLIPDAESYSLGKLVKSLGIPHSKAHRADSDARATLNLFKLLKTKDLENEIIQNQFEETNTKTYIRKIENLTEFLSNDKGIIYFQNKKGKILHSDFVENIKKYAEKIFYSKAVKYKNIQNHTEQIHFDLTGNTIIAKLLLKSKGIHKKNYYKYGLYFRNEKFLVERINLNPKDRPELKFKSFTQGLKAIHFIENQINIKTKKELIEKISLKNRTEIWTSDGRKIGEKFFIILKNGKIDSFGFYEYFSQIQKKSQINQLKINIDNTSQEIENELKLAFLQGNFKIYPIPTE